MLLSLLEQDARRVAAAVDLSPLDGKNVLVTGASGLLGLNLVAALMLSPARRIMAATRHGMPEWANPWLDDPRFVDLRFDRPRTDAPPPDMVIHGAGYGQPAKFLAEPLDTLRANTTLTDRLLTNMTPGGRFLFLSSSELYSGLKRVPHVEHDIGRTNLEHPRASYVEAKRGGEAIVNAWRSAGAQAMSARVCLAYGPGVKADDGRALNQIIRRAIVERKIVLRDQGYAIRAYCYVGDAAEMLLTILLRGTQPVYNVGNPHATSIFVVAGLVGYIEGVKVATGTTADGDPSAPREVRLDIGRYEAEFGKRAFVTLDEGLRRTLEWHRELLA